MNFVLPAISAIIPTHGRTELTKKMIESLAYSAMHYLGRFEMIIVDSSKNNDVYEIENTCRLNNAMFVPGPESVRKKRNIGATIATGEILLFIDSDCQASTDLLLKHATTYREHPDAAGVCGVTEFTGHRGYHWWIIEYTGLVYAFSFARKYDRVQWCTTSNFSVKRAVFWSAGGFDENFPFRLGGDDLDLTYRITSKVGPILCNPNAVVFHTIETWSSFKAVGERAFRWGRMGYHIFNKHRELQYFDLPKPILILFVFIALNLAQESFYRKVSSLWVIFLIVIFYLIADIIFLNKEVTGSRKFLIPFAWIYKFIYRSGLIIEFLLNGDFRFLYRKTIFSVYQLVDEWPSNVIRQWNMIFCFMIGWILWNFLR